MSGALVWLAARTGGLMSGGGSREDGDAERGGAVRCRKRGGCKCRAMSGVERRRVGRRWRLAVDERGADVVGDADRRADERRRAKIRVQ